MHRPFVLPVLFHDVQHWLLRACLLHAYREAVIPIGKFGQEK